MYQIVSTYFFIELPFIGTLDAMAYIDLEPLQLRSSNVGEREQFLLLMVMPKYLETLTFLIIWWFIVKLCFSFRVPLENVMHLVLL